MSAVLAGLTPHRSPLVVWRLSDGKRGHDNQSLALVEALGRLARVESYELPAFDTGGWRWAWQLFSRKTTVNLPQPHLCIGAGHATHWPLLACQHRFNTSAIVLMKPSLPRAWFDFCVAPEHDGLAASPRVLATRGILNRMQPADERAADTGLILLGGPSKRHSWNDEHLCEQICTLVARESEMRWTLATSRRTPGSSVQRLERIPSVRIVPFGAVGADWLPQQLQRSAFAWVSEDSVSMIFEALTAGNPTGLLAVPRRSAKRDRVIAAIDKLRDDQMVVLFEDWAAGRTLVSAPEPLDEAGRCAAWVLARLGH